ncbi:MAG: hypothetical protein KKG33_12055 [candidate division Zixibacteria bacterium]|nr:hypothetical protein [candidate division Zixibacteria bacterium]
MVVKQKFYRDYVLPLLNVEPADTNYGSFLEMGYMAWRLGITQSDLKRCRFVLAMCHEITMKWPIDSISLISTMMREYYKVHSRRSFGEKLYGDYRDAENADFKAAYLLNVYKVIFENDFRLWATIPYVYAEYILNAKTISGDLSQSVFLGASAKLKSISDSETLSRRGNLSDIVAGFDAKLRHAGAGHEDWELDDSGGIVFRVRDPRSGKLKSSINKTLSEFESDVVSCRRTIWVLHMGVIAYLNNNRVLSCEIHEQPTFKISEMRAYLEDFALDRGLRVARFECNIDRSQVSLGLCYSPNTEARGGTVRFGSGEAFDLVRIVTRSSYKNQILEVLEFLMQHFDRSRFPTVALDISDKTETVVASLVIKSNELSKVAADPGSGEMPALLVGQLPDDECVLITEHGVPLGHGKFIEKQLKEQGYEVMVEHCE